MASGSSDPKHWPATTERLSATALHAWREFAEEPRPETGHGPADAEVGDFRAAIHALLHYLAVIAGDFAAAVSRGYVRGGVSEGWRRAAERR